MQGLFRRRFGDAGGSDGCLFLRRARLFREPCWTVTFQTPIMRILHTEASLGWGGQEIRILREALGMRERGHTVVVAAQPESELLSRSKREGFRAMPVVFKRQRFLQVTGFFRRFIETERIDVVNTHSSKDSWLVLPAARLARNRPLAIRTRHLSTPVGRNPLSWVLYNVLPHVVMTTGEAIRRRLIRENRYNPDKITSVPTGVDTKAFTPLGDYRDLRKELQLPLSTPLIGAVSVIRSWKGLDYLVRAIPMIVQKVPDARFIIAGEGPYRERLERTIAEVGAGDRISLLGHRDDVADILASIDLLVHPSYAHEGVPQTILQAMAAGKPVVASDIEPLREVVRDGETGILVTVKDTESIAGAVVSLLLDKDAAGTLGRNGRDLVERAYSYTGMLDRIESLYALRGERLR